MNQLHVAYTLSNQKAFRQLLDRASSNTSASNAGNPGGTSSSGPRSWTISSNMTSIDINGKDTLGRTVLHRACSNLSPASIDFVRMLLNHPGINVNVQDLENRWTALHRALYSGNIMAAVLLLQRSDADILLKDYDGYTAFDVYNSTVEGTKPDNQRGPYDLFTWGANRNAALGLGDGNDRVYPEYIAVPRLASDPRKLGSAKFYPVQVRSVGMSKLHTTVVTSEPRGNLRLCGFDGGGRLGGNQNMQYLLSPLPQLDNTIISTACGQDHTLALTQNHEILSWGLNRFSQLGYLIETTGGAAHRNIDEHIQASPRKVIGLLKGKKINGIAACRMASAGWTDTTLYVWGTNSGQLGFQEQVQVLPRAVSTLSIPVVSVALTDTAMACLMDTKDVVCFVNGNHFKIAFPANAWPSEVKPYRPPQAGQPIVKIASCENTFAALSELGDVFTFTGPVEVPGMARDKVTLVKPQRVWALRKQMSAVVDVAPGADGSLILCTESGHVFVRSRTPKAITNTDGRRYIVQSPNTSPKAFRFQRMPYLQRIVRVATNSTGAFAAMRADRNPEPIAIAGNSLSEDMAGVRPFVVHHTAKSLHIDDAPEASSLEDKLSKLSLERGYVSADADDEDEAPIDASIRAFSQLLGVLEASKHHNIVELARAHGADMIFRCSFDFPVHRVIIASRCSSLLKVFEGNPLSESNVTFARSNKENCIEVTGCHPLALLVLLHYLYTDEVPAFWDRRVGSVMDEHVVAAATNLSALRIELQGIARLLQLPHLEEALSWASQRAHQPTLSDHMAQLFNLAQSELLSKPSLRRFASPLVHDVVLELEDRRVACHSAVLRARSPLFASFLDDKDWTSRRWDGGLLTVNFKHLKWQPMSFVFKHMYEGYTTSMFDSINFTNTLDAYLDFAFDVMSCANELLLDRLVLACSSIILRHINVTNVCGLLADASFFHANQLVNRLQAYMAINLECLLESRLVEDMDPDLINQLAKAVQAEQLRKLPVSRTEQLITHAMEKNADWLALQDIPQPIVRSSKAILTLRQSPRLSPVSATVGKPNLRTSSSIPELAPLTSMTKPDVSIDAIFEMDDDGIPALSLASLPSRTAEFGTPSSSRQTPAWKAKSTPASKIDLKAIMAETAQSGPGRGQELSKDKFRRVNPQIPANVLAASPPKDIRKSWRNQGSTPSTPPASTSSAFPPMIGTLANLRPTLPKTLSHTPPGNSSTVFPPVMMGILATSKSTPLKVLSRQPSRVPNQEGSSVPRRVPSGASLGPTITSVRSQATEPSVVRRRTNDAWSSPPVESLIAMPPTISGISFTTIQQQQKAQVFENEKPKRTLLEIQQEEEARQTELNFMSWWAAEEERIRAEEATATPAPDTSTFYSGGRGRRRSGATARRKAEERDGQSQQPRRVSNKSLPTNVTPS